MRRGGAQDETDKLHAATLLFSVLSLRPSIMHRLVDSLIVLLCAAEMTLSQEWDCSTDAGQMAFLLAGAMNAPECYTPIIALITLGHLPTTSQIEVVSHRMRNNA